MGKVFYIPGTPTAIDYALELDDGRVVTNWTRETLEQLAERYPGVVIDDEEAFIAQLKGVAALTHAVIMAKVQQ
ncbi:MULTISPECIES: hypothetical protein [Burkholderia]|uniref:hypothetical protein n=1 Tax=Burkholderia TaxID=32008 RepID=UPI0007566185|nr:MULTISPECIES: hypothetical protein [Burkholderia]KVE37247.1 hypothetical protein WS68_03265 [Burkholderia sp. TSV86]MDN7664079.1 hypothetical protein [Burkholderia cenocepacia]